MKVCFLFLLGTFVFMNNSSSFADETKFFENTLILSIPTEPKTLNVIVAQEASSTEITQYLFQGLTEFNPHTEEVEPKLAEGWEYSDDGLIWRFYLRKNVKWSDGTPFTAKDVIFTFNEIIFNSKIPTGSRDIFMVEGKPVNVRMIDDYTVEFSLPALFAPFLFTLSQPILPEHILKSSVKKGKFTSAWGIGEDPRNIVGTGPFKISTILPGEKVELIKNEFYWMKDKLGVSLPYLERIIFLIIPNAENQILRFLEGETDYYGLRGEDYPLLKPLESEKDFTIYKTGPSLGSYFAAFNQGSKDKVKRKWFKNRDFRKALAYALDRDAISDIVFNGLAVKQCAPVSPSVPKFFASDVKCYEYNPARASQILKESGFEKRSDGFLYDSDGNLVELILMMTAEQPTRFQMAQMIREDWSKLGIKVHLLSLEFNTLVTKLTVTKDWEIALIGLTGSPDPHFGANVWLSGGNLHFWNLNPKNPSAWELEIDELFRKAATTLDKTERQKYYKEWQKLASEELPLIYTVLPEVIYAVRNRFGKLKPTVLGGPFYPIEKVKTE